MLVSSYLYIYIYIYIQNYFFICYLSLYIYIHISVFIYIYIVNRKRERDLYLYVYLHVCTHTHISIYIYMCIYIYLSIYLPISLPIYLVTRTQPYIERSLSLYIYIYIIYLYIVNRTTERQRGRHTQRQTLDQAESEMNVIARILKNQLISAPTVRVRADMRPELLEPVRKTPKGKGARAVFTKQACSWLGLASSQATILSTLVERLHTVSLLLDDIQDSTPASCCRGSCGYSHRRSQSMTHT